MKVSDLKGIGQLQAVASGPSRPTPQDKVSLHHTKELQRAIEEAKVSAGASRASRLAALEAAISAGTLKPSAQQLADKLVQAAELEARLRDLLG